MSPHPRVDFTLDKEHHLVRIVWPSSMGFVAREAASRLAAPRIQQAVGSKLVLDETTGTLIAAIINREIEGLVEAGHLVESLLNPGEWVLSRR